MTIVFLTPITPLHARWIGDMARDYSWRLEQDRVSRESVSSARERRIQERKEKEGYADKLTQANIVERILQVN